MPDYETTLGFIRDLHEGEHDKVGKPYHSHPERVAEDYLPQLWPEADEDTRMAALLHDVIEDCGVTKDDLREEGYSERCIEMVHLLSKPEGDQRSYEEVIDDLIASNNKNAMIIKMADNMDNLAWHRLEGLYKIDPDKAKNLFERYNASLQKLSQATGIRCPEMLRPSFAQDRLKDQLPFGMGKSEDTNVTDNRIQQSIISNDFLHYEYYLDALTETPIRSGINHNKTSRVAEIPKETPGEFQMDGIRYVSRIIRGDVDIDKIDPATYEKKVLKFWGEDPEQSPKEPKKKDMSPRPNENRVFSYGNS